MINVLLTFDVEVWCNGWSDLDRSFPRSFERYVTGHSQKGDYALPETLAILNRHGLAGSFFVEPLFATRFGQEHLEIIVRMIRQAGHEVQLHIHPEWTNEALQPIIENCATKRQHLSFYTLDEQTTLISYGRRMLELAGSGQISAFRAGSYAANRDTFEALRRNKIMLDTSLNRCFAASGSDLRGLQDFNLEFVAPGVSTFPVTILKDGFGHDRPAQVGACSFGELRDALLGAQDAGVQNFVIVSHNFEMLKVGSTDPDWTVVRRFERLCGFLADHPEKFCVRGFNGPALSDPVNLQVVADPQATWLSTGCRYLEQLQRRVR